MSNYGEIPLFSHLCHLYDLAMLNRRMPIFAKYWGPPLAWATLIFVQSSFRMPVQALGGFRVSDKAAHAAVYALLAALVFRALRGARGLSTGRAAWLAFGLAALYGVTDELHQGRVPSRTMELSDWIADVVGAASIFLAIPLLRWAHRFRRTSRS